MDGASAFIRDLVATIVAAAGLTLRRYRAAVGPVFLVALLSALSPAPRTAGAGVAAIMWLATFLAWLWSMNRVFGIYVRGGTYAEGERAAALHEIGGAVWGVSWPALLVGAAALFAVRSVPDASGAITVLAALAIAVSQLLAGWAYTYVVTDDATPGTARARVFAAFLRLPVAAKAIVVAAFLDVLAIGLHAGALAAARGAHPAGIALVRDHQPWLVQAALLIVVDLIWWPFAYALVLTTRPTVDVREHGAASAGARYDLLQPPGSRTAARSARRPRRGEIVAPGFMSWAVRFFDRPPTRR